MSSLPILIFVSTLVDFGIGVSVQLDPKYHVYWEVDPTRTQVTFEIVAETRGWVGLGLSSNGAMTQADIFIGGVKDGRPYFNVRACFCEYLGLNA